MRRIYLWSSALILILFSLFLLLNFNTPALAHTTLALDTPTPTPDANAILSQAQTLNSVVSTGLTIIGIVLAAITIIAGLLAFLGFTSIRDTNRIKEEMRNDLEEIRNIRGALVYLNIGDRLMSLNSVSDAITNYRKASSFSPKDYEINYVLGRAYSNADYLEDAIDALTKATQLDSSRGDAWRELGLAYRRRGTQMSNKEDIQKALECLKKAIILNPSDDDAYSITGGAYRREKDYPQALANYEQAYRINPGSSYAAGNIASLAWYLNDIPKAKLYFAETENQAQRLITSGKLEGYWNYYDLALAHLVLEKPDALQRYQDALRNTPSPKIETLKGVLDNLHLLTKASTPIPHIAEVIKLLEDAMQN